MANPREGAYLQTLWQEFGMRRVIGILISSIVAIVAILWIRYDLGIGMNYAGDGGPDFLRLFRLIGLAAVAVISGLIALILLWHLAFFGSQPSRNSDDERN